MYCVLGKSMRFVFLLRFLAEELFWKSVRIALPLCFANHVLMSLFVYMRFPQALSSHMSCHHWFSHCAQNQT